MKNFFCTFVRQKISKYCLFLVAVTPLSCDNPIEVSKTQDFKMALSLAQKREELDNYMLGFCNNNPDPRWSDVPQKWVWAAIETSNGAVSIGFKPANYPQNFDYQNMDYHQTPGFKEAKAKILEIAFEEEKNLDSNLTMDKFLALQKTVEEPTIASVYIKIKNKNTMIRLMDLPEVSHFEPADYDPIDAFLQNKYISNPNGKIVRAAKPADLGLGCSKGDPANTNVWPKSDKHYATHNEKKVPVQYKQHGITNAWSGNVTGAGITIMSIDVGKKVHENIDTKFATDNSVGRNKVIVSTLPTWANSTTVHSTTDALDPVTDCQHGTRSAGIIAGPYRKNNETMPGIAYKSNLIMVRASQDVAIVSMDEIVGTLKAFARAATGNWQYGPFRMEGKNSMDKSGDPNNIISKVKVINVSMGNLLAFTDIENQMKLCFDKGILIFGSAGTYPEAEASFPEMPNPIADAAPVLFPARSNYANSVTGICDQYPDGNTDKHKYFNPKQLPQWARAWGTRTGRPRIQDGWGDTMFGIVIQQDKRYYKDANWFEASTMSLNMEGGSNPYGTSTGASCASSMMSGIAALVWSKYPNENRLQIKWRLINGSSASNNKSDHIRFLAGTPYLPDCLSASNLKPNWWPY